ncbi:DUF6950 family protein [Rhizobium sp. WCS2018Hpa-16]|uniref:DUF6950 family protein n=1 Tax=unclassified Rhizobium TaxID=2613769 RepID=UPI0039048384
MNLKEFLELPHFFEWGGVVGDDCTTFCSRWIMESAGFDPAAEYRGQYNDALGAFRIVTRAGGMVRFAAKALEPMGFIRIQNPEDGDVGVVKAPVGMDEDLKEICAIRFGPLWATLSPAGVVAKKLEFVAAWRLKS